MVNEDAILCYVEGRQAYFTTKTLKEVRGDDWNDVPYEHNADPPYERHYDFIVMFTGALVEPKQGYYNSPFCVDMINNGDVPWLRPDEWVRGGEAIPAGTTFSEFVRRVKLSHGQVYVEYQPAQP